jgi:hypothetical protein
VIERLEQSLRALTRATPQNAEVVDDFADALLLVSDCPQIQLTHAQQRALRELDELLAHRTPWGLSESQAWDDVRRRAAEALQLLKS